MMIFRARAAEICVSIGAEGAAVADGMMRPNRPAGIKQAAQDNGRQRRELRFQLKLFHALL
jgi:hypothetical protein